VQHQAILRAKETLRRVGHTRPFHRDEFLMRYGDRSDEVLLIESGAVKVVLSAENGSESIVDLYGPSELIGEMGVISGQPRSATVIAHIDGAAVHVVRDVFLRLQDEDHDVLVLINHALRRRLQNADHRHLAIASRDVPTRVAAQLLAWAKAHGEPTRAGLLVQGLTQRELAQAVTASEKSVDAALKLLRSEGLVETRRRRYLLPAPDQLEHLLSQQDWRPGR
jgi:CRP/FNR family cyclic AMP-dependent transcriptional regulator